MYHFIRSLLHPKSVNVMIFVDLISNQFFFQWEFRKIYGVIPQFDW